MLYAHNDKSCWGEQFAMACGRAGVPFKLFSKADQVPAGESAFVRLSQQADQRKLSKGLIRDLNSNGVHTLPSAWDAKMYDSKVNQYEVLKPYMPETRIIRDQDAALHIASDLEYPIISKNSEGSGSRAVRLIENRKEARREALAAFGDGIPGVYNKSQKGFVYWQKFIPKNTCDYRIVICGRWLFGIIRQNRSDPKTPFASGSGNSAPMTTMEMGTKERLCATFAMNLAKELGSLWIAFDFIFEPAGGKIYCLELSASWTPHIYAQCPVWEYMPNGAHIMETEYRGGHMFDIAVKMLIEEGRVR